MQKKTKIFLILGMLVTAGAVLLGTHFSRSDSVADSGEISEVEKVGTVKEVVLAVMNEYGVSPEQVAISYYHFQKDVRYELNEDRVMDAASTTKVATAMLFSDLIWQGDLAWDSELPYNESYYEAG